MPLRVACILIWSFLQSLSPTQCRFPSMYVYVFGSQNFTHTRSSVTNQSHLSMH